MLTHGLLSPQRAVPQDTGFSSLFLKVLMQILQWLDSPAVEDGPLQAQLKLFATRYSARHRISDGEQLRAAGRQGLVGVNVAGEGSKPSERQAESVWANQSPGISHMVCSTAHSAQWAPAPG